MRVSKLIQTSGLVAVLAASALMFAVEVRAGDRGYSVEKDASDERDTFYNDDSVEVDGPNQDSHYDEDDSRYDPIDNDTKEEGEDE